MLPEVGDLVRIEGRISYHRVEDADGRPCVIIGNDVHEIVETDHGLRAKGGPPGYSSKKVHDVVPGLTYP